MYVPAELFYRRGAINRPMHLNDTYDDKKRHEYSIGLFVSIEQFF